MRLTVNGQPQEVPEKTTVASLIERLGIKGRAVAAEVNKEVVPRRAHADTELREGDVVELVTLVGGG